MARSTLIIGNGLGMALDSEYFCLTTAMCGVWGSEDLTDVQKELIRSCLPVGCDRPENEDDFDILQLAVMACSFLQSIGSHENHWLSDHGRDFPLTTNWPVRRILETVEPASQIIC